MPLPNVPLDSQTEQKHRRLLAQAINELIKQMGAPSVPWDVVVAGASTAGTYEIATNLSNYRRLGRHVWADVYIQMAAVLTAGGAGVLLIQGLPFRKAANTFPVGSISLSGVDLDAGAIPSLTFDTSAETTDLVIRQSFDNAAATNQGIASIAANDLLIGSICYETDDP